MNLSTVERISKKYFDMNIKIVKHNIFQIAFYQRFLIMRMNILNLPKYGNMPAHTGELTGIIG